MQVEVAGESRGFTAQAVHLSELGFVEDASTLLTAIMQTVPDTVESLVVIESTANGIGNEFHNLWVKAKANRNEWVALFVPWFDEPTYRHRTKRTIDDLNDEERHRVEAYGLDMEQIEWWRRTLENKCFGDLDKMTQEYPDNERTPSSPPTARCSSARSSSRMSRWSSSARPRAWWHRPTTSGTTN